MMTMTDTCLDVGNRRKKMKAVLFLGSIGTSVLLILSMLTTVVSAQTMNVNERQTNIFQQIKEKIKNTDWKPGDILNIQHLKDVMKDGGWFPGYFILTTIFGIIALIILLITAGHPS